MPQALMPGPPKAPVGQAPDPVHPVYLAIDEQLAAIREVLLEQQDNLRAMRADMAIRAEEQRQVQVAEAAKIAELRQRLESMKDEDRRLRQERLAADIGTVYFSWVIICFMELLVDIRATEAEMLLHILKENHANRMAEIATFFPYPLPEERRR
jgi:hypothetical protein